MHLSENTAQCTAATFVTLFFIFWSHVYFFQMSILPVDTRLSTCSSKHCHLHRHLARNQCTNWLPQKRGIFPIREALIGAHVCEHTDGGEKRTGVSENSVDASHNARSWRTHPVHLRHTATARGGHLGPSGNCKIARQTDDGGVGDSRRWGGGFVATLRRACAAAGTGGCVGHGLRPSEGVGGQGGGRKIGRPLLDNSAKLWVTPLPLGAACNITSSDKHLAEIRISTLAKKVPFPALQIFTVNQQMYVWVCVWSHLQCKLCFGPIEKAC